ncbi:MAG: hypothetical protein KIT87_28475 [Anaerolineae bacterium]|nr:hypothetical protein [Anaerolineae bacterium]
MRAQLWLRFLITLAVLVMAGIATAEAPTANPTATTAAPAPNVFTYQAQIRQNGAPVNGTCDLRLTLFDDNQAGSEVGGGPQTFTSQTITNGLLTVNVPFGDAFRGGDRWLQAEVRCPAGAGSFVALTPRQHITPTPYAFGLRLPFAGSFSSPGNLFSMTNAGPGSAGYFSVTDTTSDNPALVGESISGDGVSGVSTSGWGVHGESAQLAGVRGDTHSATDGGVVGVNLSDGPGVEGYTGHGAGVYGQADAGYGVSGKSNGGTGVYGSGLYYGVYGEGSSNGVWGNSVAGNGVTGKSTSNRGVYGMSSTGVAVYGENVLGAGKAVAGISPAGVAVYGESANGVAGQFQGNVQISGTLTQTYAGRPARSMPLAYAQVNQDGVLQVGTANVSSIQWDAVNKRYVISFSNLYYGTGDYVTLVTPVRVSSIVPRVPVTSASADGKLYVYIFDLAGTLGQSNFNFVIYAP